MSCTMTWNMTATSMTKAHDPDCAIALNGRHNCSCMVEYHRPPTPYEIRFGHGAKHYKDIPVEVCRKPNGDLKKWLKCPTDGLRYYR